MIKYFVFFAFIVYSCKGDDEYKFQSIEVDKTYTAKGKISKDTVFNGLIKFYDNSTNKLEKTYNYSNGVLNGEGFEFYDNGTISASTNYENGKRNGKFIFYNEDGSIDKVENYYCDLRTGPVIKYKKNKIDEYWFLSLEGEPLIYLKYDDIINKKITNVNSNYFFINSTNYSKIGGSASQLNTEFFIYTPYFPNYNFEYSIVLIDSLNQISKVINTFEKGQNWVRFALTNEHKKLSGFIAIRLQLVDPYSGSHTLFKRIFTNVKN